MKVNFKGIVNSFHVFPNLCDKRFKIVVIGNKSVLLTRYLTKNNNSSLLNGF